MNKFTIITFILTCAGTFSACNTDNGSADFPSHMAMTTVQVRDKELGDYSFLLDDRKSIYPGDKSRIEHYDAHEKDGKRAVIYLRFLEEPVTGYDHNAAIYHISDILTKQVDKAKTNEELESLGNDRIHVEKAWVSGEWLNIYYCLQTDGHHDHTHRLSLVDNMTTTPPSDMPEGYTYLEFRHNAHGDTFGQSVKNYVCFRLGDYAPSATGAKGIYMKVTPPLGNTYYFKLEPAQSL